VGWPQALVDRQRWRRLGGGGKGRVEEAAALRGIDDDDDDYYDDDPGPDNEGALLFLTLSGGEKWWPRRDNVGTEAFDEEYWSPGYDEARESKIAVNTAQQL